MRAHFVALNKHYGTQTLVNLVKQKGHEKPVKDAYERYVDEVYFFPLVVEVCAITDLQQLARLAVCQIPVF